MKYLAKLRTIFESLTSTKSQWLRRKVVAFDQFGFTRIYAKKLDTPESRISQGNGSIEAVRFVGQKVGFHRSFDFRSPVSCLRANRFEGWASREHTRQDNGLPWRLPPAPPAAVTWRSSWSNNRMNLVICHYSFSLKASLHSKEKKPRRKWNSDFVSENRSRKSWSFE